MKAEEAAEKARTGIAYRVKDDQLYMYYVSAQGEHVADNGKNVNEGYYTQIATGKVRRFAGVRLRNYDDWKSCLPGTNAHVVFTKREGEPPGSAESWTGAIGASPVSLAMRTTKDGLLMVRKAKTHTWLESASMNEMILLRQGFRNYDGWEPMPEDHPLAKIMGGYEERYPFRRAKNAPAGIPADQIDEWVRTGDCEFMKEWRAQAAAERVTHNEGLRSRNERKSVTIQEKKADGIELHTLPLREKINEGVALTEPLLDVPEPNVLTNLGTLAEAVASGIKSMVEIGENGTAKELADQLKYLVGNASWLLRSDRTEFTKRRINDRG